MMKHIKNMSTPLKIYFMILALTALGLALSNDVLSNYFKEVYDVSAFQRGVIEAPRELPGVLCLIIVSGLSFLGDIRISMIAQLLSIVGIMVLGLVTPPFALMLIFIFINSVGMHMFFPLQESIGLSLIDHNNVGKRVGQFKGVYTGFAMVGSLFVFIGFRSGFFSFQADVKWIFIASAVLLLAVFAMLIYLNRHVKQQVTKRQKFTILFRKEYKYYYLLTIMFGVQKQIAAVYGPWVLIELLNKRTDTLAILTMIGSFIGIFFIPWIGRLLDRFGVKTILFADALSFIFVYIAFGIMSAGFYNGNFALIGLPVILMYVLFIIDKMSTQMGMVRTLYLRSIVVSQSDIMPTLSMGITLDHIVTIICAILGGLIWANYGPQYVFFLAAGLSFVNLFVATQVKKQKGFQEIN